MLDKQYEHFKNENYINWIDSRYLDVSVVLKLLLLNIPVI